MDDDPDATVLRGAGPAQRDPTTIVKPLRPGVADAATQVMPRGDPAAERTGDSDATVIRNTLLHPRNAGEAGEAGGAAGMADRTLHGGTSVRPLPKRSLALPKGLRLFEYRIERVLGQGGFGITYLATDVNLHAKVAIKEYLPEEIAFRTSDRSVSPNASQHRDRYRQGLENFLTEARTLASFRHPNIVRVARFFEAHDTAYMVLEYERGRSFKTWWLKQNPQALPPGQGERLLVERLQPLLDGLAVVHAAGYLHRDIKPDNIQVRAEDGRLVLLDFGSAGQTVALADQDAVVVTPGYAPLEQYGIGEQGAWTDLYALAATLYWAVAGRKPPDAESRAGGLALVPAAEAGKGRYGRAFLEAIDWALQPDAAQRPRSVDSWRERLLADHVASLAALGSDESRYSDEPPLGQALSGRQRWRRWRRQVLAPAAWPLAARLLPALLLAALLPLAAFGWAAIDSLQGAQDRARRAEAALRAQAAALRRAEGLRQVRALAADPALAHWLQARDEAGLARLQAQLQTVLQAARQADPDLQSLMLADTVGDLRAGTDAPRLGRSELTRADLRQALAGREADAAEAVDEAGPGGGAGGTALAAPVRDGAGAVWGALLVQWRPAAAAPPDPAAAGDDLLAGLITALQLALAAALLLALVLGLRLARSVSRPVQALTMATQALRAGRFDHSYVDTRARGELRQLVRSFNVAVDVLRQRERERETRRRS